MKKLTVSFCLLLASAGLRPGLAQAPKPDSTLAPQRDQGDSIPAAEPQVPSRSIEFKVDDSSPSIQVSAVTEFPPQCSTDGAFFLDMLDPKDLSKHNVLSIRGRQSQSYSPAAISDLHDVTVFGFFPSESTVGFLVRGSKELPGTPGTGKSPAGIEWKKYHNYVAKFGRDGSYKESIELPFDYQVSHLAILPSGEMLVSGYDRLNSAAKLLFLSSSGQILRNLDLPASRTAPQDAPFGSGASMTAASKLIGFVLFTPYGQDILVWRRGSADPILDVGPGGAVREVPLEPPAGFVFVDMVASTDRWVAHFRRQSARENSPLNRDDWAYYELRPQDASLSSKLVPTGAAPLSIACKVDGGYLAFQRDDKGKLVLLIAQ